MRTSERNWLIQRDLERYTKFAGGAVAPKIKYLQFSDTLLIWLSAQPEAPEGLQEPAQLVQSISYAASLTLASFISAGIPLRGAVGFGAVFVSTEPLFFTGKELYETIMLERQQAWAGAALHASAMAVLEKESIEPFCLDYDVPMSHKLAIAPTVAVDWVTPISQSPDLVPPWSRMFPETQGDQSSEKGRRDSEILRYRRFDAATVPSSIWRENNQRNEEPCRETLPIALRRRVTS